MRKCLAVLLLMGATAPAAAQFGTSNPSGSPAQSVAAAPQAGGNINVFPDIEYISGHDGFPDKKKGQLVVSAKGVQLADEEGHEVFTLPAAIIRNAEFERDIRDASVGKKLLFGVFAGSRKQEFITINTETESNAEGVVIKTKQNVASGIVAKINFWARKAHEGAPLPAGADSSAIRARKD